ncbi:myoD family inhibitor domain-containing protein 2-like [Osmerus mordax]|uniref:myoD family inhibitor domain-containing protein 2-like n=1 Tax=Osmerus mordax TaxID=8014 RepID=UPI00351059C8
MSTQSKTSPEESDYFNARNDKSPLIEGDISPPVQPRVKSKVVVSGVRRLSTISEQDADKVDTDLHYQVPLGGNGWDESSFSLCSDKYNISSGLFSLDSHQPDSGDDCAAILLECLYCRFCDLLAMLPDTCERAVGRCFPSLKYRNAASEQEKGGDCCSCSLKLDCGCCSACQETAELLELAMEISEVCFR